MKSHYLLLLLTFLISSCTPEYSNRNMAYMKVNISDNDLTIKKDPSFNVSDYRTFSFIKPIDFFPKPLIKDPIDVKIIFRQLQFFLESKGYKHVESGGDFYVSINGDSKYKESYIPPRTVTNTTYIPEETITTTTTDDTNSETTTSSTYIPGKTVTESHVEPGYTIGRNYPTAFIPIIDGKSNKKVWSGSAVGKTKSSNYLLSFQLLVRTIFSKFPNSKYHSEFFFNIYKKYGFNIRAYSGDGNNLQPTIVDLDKKSISKKSGLSCGDIILEINGQKVTNSNYGIISNLLSKPLPLNIIIWRDGKKLPITIKK